MSKLTSLSSLVAAAAGIVLSGCGSKSHVAPAPPLPQVSVGRPIERSVVDWHEFTGRVEATESVEIRPRVTGHVEEIRFESGQLVGKGDVLFVIDPRWHKATLDNAEAELQRAQVQLSNAERDAQRTVSLSKTSAISGRDADSRMTQLATARAAVLGAQAARDSAALDFEATQVRSPIAGRVSRPLLTVGNYVSGVPGFTTLLTTVVTVDPVHVYVAVDEAKFLEHQKLQREGKFASLNGGRVPAEVQLDGESDFPHRGWIESFDNRIDAATGSIVMRALVPNPAGLLVPGGFARVRIPGGTEQPALLVDEKIIGTDQNQRFVLTVGANSVAEYRKVTLGPAIDGLRVIRDGLKADDVIITSGLQMVRPGTPVTTLAATPEDDRKSTAAR